MKGHVRAFPKSVSRDSTIKFDIIFRQHLYGKPFAQLVEKLWLPYTCSYWYICSTFVYDVQSEVRVFSYIQMLKWDELSQRASGDYYLVLYLLVFGTEIQQILLTCACKYTPYKR